MNVTHVLDHLIPSHKAILAASMATGMLAVYHRCAGSSMHRDNVSFQVSFPSEILAGASTRLVEAEVSRTTRYCSVLSTARGELVTIYPSLDNDPPSEGGDSVFGCWPC